MYPVGVLFGFGKEGLYVKRLVSADLCKGFDTASSIALLAVSAIAKKGGDSKRIPTADIIILPVASLCASSQEVGLTCTIRCYSRLG